MLVLQINKFFPFIRAELNHNPCKSLYQFGGVEAVMLSIEKILKERGHRTIYFAMRHPEGLKCETSDFFMPYLNLSKNNELVSQINTVGRVLYSFEAKKNLSMLLDKYKVDIAHIHNIYHHISPSILHELRKRGIPIIMTLHDYKMVCASYSMLFKNKPCEDCLGRKYYKVIKNRCVKDSLLKSTLAAVEMYFHHTILDIYSKVDVFISPSLFLKEKLKEMGFKKEIIHMPNLVDIQKLSRINEVSPEESKNSIVYFGRLSQEKGLWTLLEAAKILASENAYKGIEIKIIGDGLIKHKVYEKVKVEGIKNVRFFGHLQGENLYHEIKGSSIVVLTSECYENNPMSVLESFAMAKPVIGARIGGIPELVKDMETGLTFEPGNPFDLSEKIKYLLNNPDVAEEMGRKAKFFVEQKLNAEGYYRKLMEIYNYAISKKRDVKSL